MTTLKHDRLNTMFQHGLQAGRPWYRSLEGSHISDDFQILRLIGRGGMGVVYEGRQESLKRRVALKILDPKRAADEIALKRFHREAQAIGALSHPHIVQVFSVIHEGPFHVIVMELIEGPSLTRMLKRESRLEPRRAARLCVQILAAIGAAHSAGVVHRDLKPGNVIVGSVPDLGEWAKVVDFGLALMLESTGVTRLTQAGAIFGTPAFMSPEQVRGDPVDPRADLYAVGALIYFLIAGRPLYDVRTFGELLKALEAGSPKAEELTPEIPPPLVPVVARALDHQPERRFSDAGEMARALRAVEDELGDLSRPRISPIQEAVEVEESYQPPVVLPTQADRDVVAEPVQQDTGASLSRGRGGLPLLWLGGLALGLVLVFMAAVAGGYLWERLATGAERDEMGSAPSLQKCLDDAERRVRAHVQRPKLISVMVTISRVSRSSGRPVPEPSSWIVNLFGPYDSPLTQYMYAYDGSGAFVEERELPMTLTTREMRRVIPLPELAVVLDAFSRTEDCPDLEAMTFFDILYSKTPIRDFRDCVLVPPTLFAFCETSDGRYRVKRTCGGSWLAF